MATLPQPVIVAMADRAVRLYHALWHASRDTWERLTEAQRKVYRDHDWEPPRPSLTANSQVQFDNGSGEDFLFMHREMIRTVNEILTDLADPQHPRVVGWPSIPGAEDAEFPVPPPFIVPGNDATTSSIQRAKSAETLARLREREAEVTDPAVLRGMPLGRLGAFIEFRIHNTLHMRWAAERPKYRPGGSAFDVDTQWDVPSYDWLADTYSSHVNPIFWKLHGWVDARIDDWMRANDKTGPVPWTFDPPWTGPATPGHHHHHVVELARRARPGNAEAVALESHVRALEDTIGALKDNGIPEPVPFIQLD
ncbi:Tat pathway signal protein [Nonomuraea turkmeniaca]|uniref:Tat pathway signal protein n=1 Tax=Nonomuraea turkmeniaca TaxID=103838 RepID=A0A5S4F155_9ACTN|nr:Tat pathway signal protein [Nonomuraea turkmeniaca]TMR09680.1 Tat pathway signal protein [Nonomuraea turkmeniaca]